MFQFTHPGKGATSRGASEDMPMIVSIHAPWEGCDSLHYYPNGGQARFNSRTLGRVRRSLIITPLRDRHVSIHAPWEGCDLHINSGSIPS